MDAILFREYIEFFYMDLYQTVFIANHVNAYSNFCYNMELDFLSCQIIRLCFLNKKGEVHEQVNILLSLNLVNKLPKHHQSTGFPCPYFFTIYGAKY
jgi:hypothetical protein